MKKVTFIKTHKKNLKIEVTGQDDQVDQFIKEFEEKFEVYNFIEKR